MSIYFSRPLNEDNEYPQFIECKLYYLGELLVTTYIKNSRVAAKRFENKVCRYMFFKDNRVKISYQLDYTEMKGFHADKKPKTIHHKLPRCK